MKVFIISIFIVSLMLCCKDVNNENKDQLIIFDLKKIPEIKHLKLSELGFEDIEYIPLETNERSMLPNIDELTFMANNMIIAENNYFLIQHWNLILKFRNDGSFVCRIGTEGRGPTEYTVAHDIDVNPENHTIFLVSAWQKKFNVYSDNGEFIRSFQMPIYGPVKFRFVDGNILCYSDNLQGNVENSFVLMDTNGIILKNFSNKYPFNRHKAAFGFARENLFYRFHNQLLKKEVYSDTIYIYKNMDFRPSLVIKVGEKLITPKARSEFEGMEIGKKYINPFNLFEFGYFVYYAFGYEFKLGGESKVYGFFGSRKNNYQSVINLKEGLINDLDGGPNFLPLTTKDDNTVIAIIDALKLKTHVASIDFKNSKPKLPQKKKELEKLAYTLKETDNPVLVLVKLKK
jgi:hypothetical protein